MGGFAWATIAAVRPPCFPREAAHHLGQNVKIGGNVRIYDHDFHAVNYLARRDPQQDAILCKSLPVVIGDDILIGANAIILKGVTIGDRSVIGAGASRRRRLKRTRKS
jgi:acetyltransferase-like isoleucine patch superfamily enzyme